MWKLVIEDDEGKRTLVPLTREDYSIGRQEGNTIRLTERNVSREHGCLRRKSTNGANGSGAVATGAANGSGAAAPGHTNGAAGREVYVIEDRSSYNGVFVNGVRVATSQELQNGDLIQIGDYRLVLSDESAQAVPNDTAVIPIVATDFDVKATIPMSAGLRGQTLTERPNRFVMLVGPNPGVEFPLDRERMTIGRAEDANISVNHNSVSRLHCEVHALEGGRYEIVDKGSSNGVRVNAVELRRSIIEAGDIIELGDVRFKFVGKGQVFVPGPNESQQLTAISDREAELVDSRRRGFGGGYATSIVAAGILGAGVILGAVYLLRERASRHAQDAQAAPLDPEQQLLLEAKKSCTLDDCEIPHSQVTTQLPPESPWRNAPDFHQIEATWADSVLRKADAEEEPAQRRALLQRVIGAPTVDEARRKRASDLLNPTSIAPQDEGTPAVVADKNGSPIAHDAVSALPAVTTAAPPPTTPPPTTRPTATGASVSGSTSTTSATTPSPSGGGGSSASGSSANAKSAANLEKARTAALEGRSSDVRALLEGRVKSGHASAEEVKLVRGACQAMSDMVCLDDIRKRY